MALRRTLAGLLGALLFLAVFPISAQGAFSATDSSGLSASTYQIQAPANVSATITCTSSNGKSASATVTAYSAVQRATGYRFVLTAPDGTSTSSTVGPADSAGNTTLPAPLSRTSTSAGNRNYTLTVQALLGSWSGTAWTLTRTC
jgi:hypothetical protein